MSLISALKDYLEDYSELEEGAPVWVNFLGVQPVEYAIVPLAGTRIVSEDLAGNTERQFPFAFQSVESTADELERLGTTGFYEAFADWLETQTDDEAFPDLGEGKTATKIEALGQGYLYQQGDSQTGVYQIQCLLSYDQDAN